MLDGSWNFTLEPHNSPYLKASVYLIVPNIITPTGQFRTHEPIGSFDIATYEVFLGREPLHPTALAKVALLCAKTHKDIEFHAHR